MTHIYSGQLEVQRKIPEFYVDLCKKSNCNNYLQSFKDFLRRSETPKFTEAEADQAEVPCTKTKLREFTKSEKLKKSPGTIWVNAGCYKFHWKLIPTIISGAVNNILRNGIIPENQRQGALALIPLSSKEQKYIGNFKLIKLLIALHNIFSGCITNRHKPGLDKILNQGQAAYLPGWYISEITRNV